MPDVHHPDGISITLSHATSNAPWLAVAVVINHLDRRHRITFRKDRPIALVFRPELVAMLTPVLDDFGPRNEVYSNPDARLRLPGLSMQEMRINYCEHGTDPASALVRFSAYAGNPNCALLGEDGFSYPLDALSAQLYRDALDWVLLPALNIVAVEDLSEVNDTNSFALRAALNKLRGSHHQLLFQVEMVKRELGRLEAHSYARQIEMADPNPSRVPVVAAAEPAAEEFRTLKALRAMD